MRKDQVNRVISKVVLNKQLLGKVLKDHGYEQPDENTFKALISKINEMYIFDVGADNSFVTLDQDGYIESVIGFNTDQVIKDHSDFPEDMLDGYHKLEDGIVVEDQERKDQLYKPY